MKKFGDLNWRVAPLISFLNAFGGWGFKWVRRFGVPIAIVFWAFLRFGYRRFSDAVLYLALALGIFGVFSLPLTLIGDSVHQHWFNWIWLWLMGPIQVLALIPLFMFHDDWDKPSDRWRWGFFIHCVVFGGLSTLSNIVGYPIHSLFEIAVGLSYGLIAAWIIGEDYQ